MRYRYVSGDSHVEIDSKYWVGRVPAKHRDRAPRLVHLTDGSDAWQVEGIPLREVPTDLFAGKPLETYRPFGQSYATTPGTGPASQRLRELDQDGLDAEVLFPGVSGPAIWRSIADDDAYRAVVRAYNDFLAEDYCSENPERLIGLGVIPWTGVDDAVAEMEHCARLGLKGVHLGAFPSAKPYPTADDDRFWAAALHLNMAIAVHVTFNRPPNAPLLAYEGVDPKLLARIGERRAFAAKLAAFSSEAGRNAVQLILSGVFDRFPALKIFFAETEAGWVPLFAESADFRYNRHIHWAEQILGQQRLRRQPSEYIREHFYWGILFDRVGVQMRHLIGADRIIWSTDFPHQDTEWPNSRATIERVFAGVPEDEKHLMVAGNVVDFFHLDQE